ncbi:DUF7667 family protein [Paenibacillus turpanensis]|uniref:DUF7667 family protein n=1 Tax=Paenibacillus turpanensis TaxID=2689078 RepID=UPI0014083851|nr:hypothetical protein [Paenibacillus turpanensis]
MLGIHQRMAELWTIQKRRALTKEELNELSLCMEANANYVWKMAKLHNMSLTASMSGDTEWLHDICLRIEELEAMYAAAYRKPNSL